MPTPLRWTLVSSAVLLAAASWRLNAQSASAVSLCSTVTSSQGSGTGSALSTFPGGAIALGNATDAGGRCALTFEAFSAVNVGTTLFSAQGSGSASTYCKNTATQRIVASGTNFAKQTLPTFQSTTTTYDVKLLNSSQVAMGNGGATSVNRTTSPTTVTVDGRTLTLAAQGNEVALPTGVSYRTLSVENGNRMALTSASGSPTTVIQSLSLSGCNSAGGITVSPGDYYIDTLSIAAGCRISVSGTTGRANFYVKNGFTTNGGPTCINFPVDASYKCAGTATSAADATRFSLRVYTGDLLTQGDISMAGAFYVHSGNFNSGDGGLYRIVGEVVASNIKMLGNDGTVVRYQDTGAFPVSISLRNGEYALAPPAVPASAVAGDLAYLPAQRDIDSTGKESYSGTLYAHAMNADGSISATATWDATALMTATDRTSKLWTQSSAATPTLVALSAVDDSAFGTYSSVATELRRAIPNPNALSGKYLSGRDATRMVGRLHRTAPVIAGQVVVFASEDGIVYAVDKATGALRWGFIPRQVLPQTGKPSQMIQTAVWGQLAYVPHGGKGYVTGSVLKGQVHLSLEISATTGALARIAFIDDASPATSPASPYGGDAPIPALTTDSADNVYYVVGNKIKQRPVDGTGSVTTLDLGTVTATSNLVANSPSEVYVGASTGKVYKAGVSPSAAAAEKFTVDTTEAVLTLSGLSYASSAGSQLVLAGTTADTLKVQGTASAAPSWSTSTTASSNASIPVLPASGRITAPAQLTPDARLILPLTVGSSCLEQAYAVGPLMLDTGALSSNAKLRQVALSASINLIGNGEALAARSTTIGSRRFGIATGGGGSGSKTGTRDATQQWGEMEWGRKTYSIKVRNWREVTRDLP